MSKVLIIGACGQIGTELILKLRSLYGNDNIIASDIKEGNEELMNSGPFETIDATDREAIVKAIEKHQVKEVYLMAAMLSATAEKYPIKGWDLNMDSLLIVLELAKDKYIDKLYWASSMAVFGPTSPKDSTPQATIMEPTTVYGISKLTGEHWCNYYHNRYGVDVRSIRYPGIISWKTLPGGGTTDYAVEIFYEAISSGKYESFLSEETTLPMMYMDDAIKATIGIMNAKAEDIKVRTSYNLSAMSFSPKELAEAIKNIIPEFEISYKPDSRQAIADSWTRSIDDSVARQDWKWQNDFDLNDMVETMIKSLRIKLSKTEAK
ncbi:MAG: NAD-dependent epimerase/dehydratase family protein [Flavobacteriaceae bacterium]|nr:NAD-dependent epimerase/dehydratase family protein [Flavobacteriaceae bacterium]